MNRADFLKGLPMLAAIGALLPKDEIEWMPPGDGISAEEYGARFFGAGTTENPWCLTGDGAPSPRGEISQMLQVVDGRPQWVPYYDGPGATFHR